MTLEDLPSWLWAPWGLLPWAIVLVGAVIYGLARGAGRD